MVEWRLLEFISANGAMQMAIDEAIGIACSKGESSPTLRIYKFEPSAITIGYHQSSSNFDISKIKKKGLDYVRRMTGGTAVLHKNDLVYCLVLPEKFLPEKVIDAYNYLSDGLVRSLTKLGLKAEKKYSEKKNRKDSCYLNENPYDVVIKDRKISGNAQTRFNGIVLQHGTIIIENNINELFDCLKLDKNQKKFLLNEAIKKVTCVEEELGKKSNILDIKDLLIDGFKELFLEKDIKFKIGELNNYEKSLAENLYKEKYSTEKWWLNNSF